MRNPQNPAKDLESRERAISLFTFLRELTQLRTKTVRTIEEYEQVLWFCEIPREQGCHCVAWQQGQEREHEEDWIEIRKPRLKDPPALPEDLKPWLDPRHVADSSLEFPELRERIIVPIATEDEGRTEEVSYRYLKDSPEIKDPWERYVEDKWWPWAEEDRRLQAVQKAYTGLFSIYQKQQRLGEQYEVILGLGYLTWETPTGHRVRRHIITAQTALSFDAARGVISLRPAGEGAKPTLEQDMLELQERPDPAELKTLEQQVAEIGDDVWDATQMHAVLTGWAHAASPRGEFKADLEPQKDARSDPRVHLAPAIVLRKRTERTLLRVYQEVLDQMQEGGRLPLGIHRFVTQIDDGRAAHEEESRDRGREPSDGLGELLFPLPANDEQREIARKLSTRQGVLVQGPPGTGKSHTIANLICHLLSEGNRVLVTSHAPRALKVLRKKIPSELTALCVSLLGNDQEALQALEDSVQRITDKHSHWNSKANNAEIKKLEEALHETRRREAQILHKLRAIREKETYHQPPICGDYQGTARSIAERLRREEASFGWLRERPAENQAPPLSDEEASELLLLLRAVGGEGAEGLRKVRLSTKEIFAPEDFKSLVKQEAEAGRRYENSAPGRSYSGYRALERADSNTRKVLRDGLEELLESFGNVARHVEPWTETAALEIMADKDRSWRELLATTRDHLAAIGDRGRRADELQISGLGDRDRRVIQNDAQDLMHHLWKGGRLGRGPFRPKVVKRVLYLLKEIRIDGRPCNNPRALEALLVYLDVTGRIDALRKRWSEHAEVSAKTIAGQVASYEDLCEPLEAALELHNKVSYLRMTIERIPGLSQPAWHSPEGLRGLLAAVTASIYSEQLQRARQQLKAVEDKLREILGKGHVHPAVEDAFGAVHAGDTSTYRRAYETLQGLEKLEKLFNRVKSAAPELVSELVATTQEPCWDGRLADFGSAWNWARADLWFREFVDPRTEEILRRELNQIREQTADLIRMLAEARAWGHCFSRLSEHERQHLVAWTIAVRRIGKGTGKYAAQHRRAAREHMEECRSTIPAWVMPIYRVAETVRPGKDLFDVVIIDEASQSGADALFLLYLAKKVLVVGDDKQISPDYVGITREDVNVLRERYIPHLEHSDAIGVDNSLFDLAQIFYGGRIRLREHFRCMPEIIQFSNNLCYRSEPLIPLKQYAAGRLSPVIVVRHVPEGYVKGDHYVVNLPEAEALVNQIVQCCQMPEYEGKTMGVISLQGYAQAQEIAQRLVEQLGPEKMEKREVVCGDAYAFQGDERDIIFLSMVAAPSENRRIGTLADQKTERRFNVAASRAKEQLWLFHTATLTDLSLKCLRHQLLKYCLNPIIVPTEFGGNLLELRGLARTANRSTERPPKPFKSWFELDVFVKIVDRGFRVLPQFEVAGYWIDLVVDGLKGRLAVECDGEHWHGVDRYEEDMARQRELERCGVTFWRLRDSVFYRNPDEAMESLWTMLERLNIRPDAASEEPYSSSVDDRGRAP